jgi:hypothetical protein
VGLICGSGRLIRVCMPRAVPLACMHAAIMEAPHMDIHSANRQLLTSKCDKIQQKQSL